MITLPKITIKCGDADCSNGRHAYNDREYVRLEKRALVLPGVPVETSTTLGSLKRQGFAISVILIALDTDELLQSHGRLLAEGIRDVRHVGSEAELSLLGDQAPAAGVNPYQLSVTLA